MCINLMPLTHRLFPENFTSNGQSESELELSSNLRTSLTKLIGSLHDRTVQYPTQVFNEVPMGFVFVTPVPTQVFTVILKGLPGRF